MVKIFQRFDIGCVVSSQLGVYVASCFIGNIWKSKFSWWNSDFHNQIGSVDINNIQVGIIEWK